MNIPENKISIGTKLEIEIFNRMGEKVGQTYISQLIEIIDENNILVAIPIHETKLMLIPTGTKIRVILFSDKHGLLNFRGSVTGKDKKGNIMVMNIRIESDLDKIQRREYYRLSCVLNMAYRLYTEEEDNSGNTDTVPKPEYKKNVTRNISGCGASVIVNEEIEKGACIEVIIWLSKEIHIKVICKVVRSTPLEQSYIKKYELGLYFIKISQKDQDALVKFIFEQQKLLLKKGNIK